MYTTGLAKGKHFVTHRRANFKHTEEPIYYPQSSINKRNKNKELWVAVFTGTHSEIQLAFGMG